MEWKNDEMPRPRAVGSRPGATSPVETKQRPSVLAQTSVGLLPQMTSIEVADQIGRDALASPNRLQRMSAPPCPPAMARPRVGPPRSPVCRSPCGSGCDQHHALVQNAPGSPADAGAPAPPPAPPLPAAPPATPPRPGCASSRPPPPAPPPVPAVPPAGPPTLTPRRAARSRAPAFPGARAAFPSAPAVPPPPPRPGPASPACPGLGAPRGPPRPQPATSTAANFIDRQSRTFRATAVPRTENGRSCYRDRP